MSINKISTESSYLVNVLSFSWAAMTFNNWMMLISAIAGIGTGVVSWYYKRKEDIRQSEKHEIELELVKNKQPNGLADD